jgi:hypothetical protein
MLEVSSTHTASHFLLILLIVRAGFADNAESEGFDR